MTNKNQEVASALATAVNCFCDCREVSVYLSREHRTLQQTFTKVCVEWIKTLSMQQYYDDRNAASVKLAQSLMDIPEVKDLLDNARLPLI